jgi:hypothetical protein
MAARKDVGVSFVLHFFGSSKALVENWRSARRPGAIGRRLLGNGQFGPSASSMLFE